MDYLIYGAGAVGLGLGSCLLAAGERVRFLARPHTVAALQRHGLVRTGLFGEYRTTADRFAAGTALEELSPTPADWVFVATKSFDSEAAAELLSAAPAIVGDKTQILLCQNGWGNAELFAARFPPFRIWNARIITGFHRRESHHVEVTVHAQAIHLGSLFQQDVKTLEPVARAIAAGGIPCETSPDIAADLWAKLLYNNCLNALSAIFRVPYGALGESLHGRRLMQQLAEETFAVMQAAGYRTHWNTAQKFLAAFYNKLLPPTAQHESSTLQDLRDGRRTEIGALNGAVVSLGKSLDVSVPINRAVVDMIQFLEAKALSSLQNS